MTDHYSMEAVNELKQPLHGYTAEDLRTARTAWLDARMDVAQAEADLSTIQAQYAKLSTPGRVKVVEQASNTLHAAKETMQAKEEHFHEVQKEASHLEAAEANQAQIARMRQQEDARREEDARLAKQAWLDELRPKFLFNGGTPERFRDVGDRLWNAELEKRALSGRDLEMERLKKQGNYTL